MSRNRTQSLLVFGGMTLFGVVLGGLGLGIASHLDLIGNGQTSDQTTASPSTNSGSQTIASNPAPAVSDDVTTSDQATIVQDDHSEEEEEALALKLIENMAAHPDDPQNKPGVVGVSDEDFAAMPDEDIVDLFDKTLDHAEKNSDQPQYLFALGRAALQYGETEWAKELLELAASNGSAAAEGYLAHLTDDRELMVSHLTHSMQGGFKPATGWLAEVEQVIAEEKAAEIAAQQAAARAEPDFSDFEFPDLMQAFYEGTSAEYAQKPLLPVAYIAGLSEVLSNGSMVLYLDDPKTFLREIDPNLGVIAGRRLASSPTGVSQTTGAGLKAMMGMFTAMAGVRKSGGSISEEIAAANSALYNGGSTNSSGVSYMSIPEIKTAGNNDGRVLALMFNENPDAFRQLYKGMQRFVHQELR